MRIRLRVENGDSASQFVSSVLTSRSFRAGRKSPKRKAPEAGFGFRDDQYNRGTTLIPVERRALVGYFHILCLGNGASRNRLPLPARRFCSGVRVPSPAPPACTNRRFSVRAFLDGTVPSSHLCKDYSTRPPLCQRVIENILSSEKTTKAKGLP